MEKDQLISMIHFLVKREDERAQENQELKDMVKDLRDIHKQDVKTQSNLMKSIDRLTNQVADLTSVIYHTFIETCKMCGVSTLEYFKEFFKAIMQGRTDYENMLPMTIGIKK